MDEIRLIKKAKRGNDHAFEQLIIKYENQLYRTAFLYVQNRDDALDIVQETVLKAYRSISQIKKPQYFKTWLIRILINSAYELLSMRKKVIDIRREYKKDAATRSVSNTNKTDQSIILQEAIRQLDKDYKTVIILFYYHDLSIRHIADTIKIPEGTVKTYLYRARKDLKSILGGSDSNWIKSGLKMK